MAYTGPRGRRFGNVVKAGLFIWAIDEILRGVNPWRRLLGIAVLGYEITTSFDSMMLIGAPSEANSSALSPVI
jgi:hypothetical protein